MHVQEIGQRIDAACFVDGDDDEYVVEFWGLPGSIARTVYNRRNTVTRTEFLPVDSWEYIELSKLAAATDYAI